MKIKNYVLFDTVFIDALMAFANLPIPVKASYPLSKCLKIFHKEEVSLKTAKNNLIKKYGEETFYDENDILPEGVKIGSQKGWDMTIAPIENQNAYNKEIYDLVNMEFDIDLEDKINLSLNDIGNLEVSAGHIDKISLIVEFTD